MSNQQLDLSGQQTEVFALRHQLAVLHANAPRRLRLKRSDRLLWVLLARFWRDWRRCLQIETSAPAGATLLGIDYFRDMNSVAG